MRIQPVVHIGTWSSLSFGITGANYAAFTWNRAEGTRQMDDTRWMERETQKTGLTERQNDAEQHLAVAMLCCLQQIK